MWQILGWKFCPQHLSKSADQLNQVEVTEVERLDRCESDMGKPRSAGVRPVSDEETLTGFESTEKVWLYGDKRCLDV